MSIQLNKSNDALQPELNCFVLFASNSYFFFIIYWGKSNSCYFFSLTTLLNFAVFIASCDKVEDEVVIALWKKKTTSFSIITVVLFRRILSFPNVSLTIYRFFFPQFKLIFLKKNTLLKVNSGYGGIFELWIFAIQNE